ncbi:hypothetical protein QM716_23425 [Rhodococcus sp. IEGM 1409]|uniref:hypothetical protein n=1 Tax=Rhodococcus sp. IEGM 1409 TaxID=3047082 RepID=UPI0024B83408|nr:hypothetical protein [Rhodococcus sp. IEGM 1409]MDI9902813.1 hypothetical protein [Rhodococcus sp. IEGM 1409]
MNSYQFLFLISTALIGATVGVYNIYLTKRTETRKELVMQEIAIRSEASAARDFLKSKRQEAYGKYWATRSNWIAAQSVYDGSAQLILSRSDHADQEIMRASQGILNEATNQLRAASLEAMIVGSSAIAQYIDDELSIANDVITFYALVGQPNPDVDAAYMKYRASIQRMHKMALHSNEFVFLARLDLDATDV